MSRRNHRSPLTQIPPFPIFIIFTRREVLNVLPRKPGTSQLRWHLFLFVRNRRGNFDFADSTAYTMSAYLERETLFCNLSLTDRRLYLFPAQKRKITVGCFENQGIGCSEGSIAWNSSWIRIDSWVSTTWCRYWRTTPHMGYNTVQCHVICLSIKPLKWSLHFCYYRNLNDSAIYTSQWIWLALILRKQKRLNLLQATRSRRGF